MASADEREGSGEEKIVSRRQHLVPVLSITLLRHGETTGNVARRIQGHQDGSLTAEGARQAEIAGQRLAGETQFTQLFSSDLGRTRETAMRAVPGARFVGSGISSGESTAPGAQNANEEGGEVEEEKEEEEEKKATTLTAAVPAPSAAGESSTPRVVQLTPLLREKGSGMFEGQPLGAADDAAKKLGEHRRKFRPPGESGESWEDVHERATRFVTDLLAETCPAFLDRKAECENRGPDAGGAGDATAISSGSSGNGLQRRVAPRKGVDWVDYRAGWPCGDHDTCPARVLAVTHGGFIREVTNVIGSWTGRAPPRAAARNTSLTTYVFGFDLESGRPSVLLARFNDAKHLS